MLTIKQAIDKAAAMLKSSQIETPKMQARLLLQYVLKKPRQYLIIYDTKVINKKVEEKYFKYVQKIKNGVPLQHITHTQEWTFM